MQLDTIVSQTLFYALVPPQFEDSSAMYVLTVDTIHKMPGVPAQLVLAVKCVLREAHPLRRMYYYPYSTYCKTVFVYQCDDGMASTDSEQSVAIFCSKA